MWISSSLLFVAFLCGAPLSFVFSSTDLSTSQTEVDTTTLSRYSELSDIITSSVTEQTTLPANETTAKTAVSETTVIPISYTEKNNIPAVRNDSQSAKELSLLTKTESDALKDYVQSSSPSKSLTITDPPRETSKLVTTSEDKFTNGSGKTDSSRETTVKTDCSTSTSAISASKETEVLKSEYASTESTPLIQTTHTKVLDVRTEDSLTKTSDSPSHLLPKEADSESLQVTEQTKSDNSTSHSTAKRSVLMQDHGSVKSTTNDGADDKTSVDDQSITTGRFETPTSTEHTETVSSESSQTKQDSQSSSVEVLEQQSTAFEQLTSSIPTTYWHTSAPTAFDTSASPKTERDTTSSSDFSQIYVDNLTSTSENPLRADGDSPSKLYDTTSYGGRDERQEAKTTATIVKDDVSKPITEKTSNLPNVTSTDHRSSTAMFENEKTEEFTSLDTTASPVMSEINDATENSAPTVKSIEKESLSSTTYDKEHASETWAGGENILTLDTESAAFTEVSKRKEETSVSQTHLHGTDARPSTDDKTENFRSETETTGSSSKILSLQMTTKLSRGQRSSERKLEGLKVSSTQVPTTQSRPQPSVVHETSTPSSAADTTEVVVTNAVSVVRDDGAFHEGQTATISSPNTQASAPSKKRREKPSPPSLHGMTVQGVNSESLTTYSTVGVSETSTYHSSVGQGTETHEVSVSFSEPALTESVKDKRGKEDPPYKTDVDAHTIVYDDEPRTVFSSISDASSLPTLTISPEVSEPNPTATAFHSSEVIRTANATEVQMDEDPHVALSSDLQTVRQPWTTSPPKALEDDYIIMNDSPVISNLQVENVEVPNRTRESSLPSEFPEKVVSLTAESRRKTESQTEVSGNGESTTSTAKKSAKTPLIHKLVFDTVDISKFLPANYSMNAYEDTTTEKVTEVTEVPSAGTKTDHFTPAVSNGAQISSKSLETDATRTSSDVPTSQVTKDTHLGNSPTSPADTADQHSVQNTPYKTVNSTVHEVQVTGMGVKTTVSVALKVADSVNSTLTSSDVNLVKDAPIASSSESGSESTNAQKLPLDQTSTGNTVIVSDETSLTSSTQPSTTTARSFRIRKPKLKITGDSPVTTRSTTARTTTTRRPTTAEVKAPVSIFRKNRTRMPSITSSTTPGTTTRYVRPKIVGPVRIAGTEAFDMSLLPQTTPSTTSTTEEVEEEEEEEPEYETTEHPAIHDASSSTISTNDDITLLKIVATVGVDRGIRWKNQLHNRHSPEYAKQSRRMQRTLQQMFRNTPVGANLWKIDIDGFIETYPGSRTIVVDYTVYLVKTTLPVNGKLLVRIFNDQLVNNTYSRYLFDPAFTQFQVIQEEKLNKPTEPPEVEPPIPQWAIAVIVIGAASFIFIVLFAAVTVYGRHHMRRRYMNKLDEDLERSVDSTDWENKMANRAAYENLAADGIYDAEDSGSIDKMKRAKYVPPNPPRNPRMKHYDSWRTEWTEAPKRIRVPVKHIVF